MSTGGVVGGLGVIGLVGLVVVVDRDWGLVFVVVDGDLDLRVKRFFKLVRLDVKVCRAISPQVIFGSLVESILIGFQSERRRPAISRMRSPIVTMRK